MHLFRSILNAHFLRYVTLVIVVFYGFSLNFQGVQNTAYPISTGFNTTFANGLTDEENAQLDDLVNGYFQEKAQKATKDVDTTLINVLNTVIALISLIYVPFSMLSSWLLSPDWTFGDFIHLRGTLHSLWIFVSNTVYVVFAAMLIVVAIANIFGQSDSYAIKKMLPRFIIGVIMVPFTWWIVSATLSVSSYMTALVLRMPADIINANPSIETMIEAPKNCYLDFTHSDNSKKIWDCDKPESRKLSEYLLKSDNTYGIIPLYAYNIFKFNNLDAFKTILNSDDTKVAGYESMTPEDKAKFDAADKETKSAMLQAAIIATGLGKIGIQLLMSALFAIVFTVVLIALVLVLFTRVIRMWMYAIFSPLFALRYFLSDKIDKDNALSKFDFKEFIGLAMVPVVVSAALGFGFMFIMTFKTHMEQPTKAGATQQGIESDYIQVTDNNANSGSIQFFGTTINIRLSDTNGAGVGADGNSVKADDLKAALFNVLSGLITPIFGVVILWMAVMAAIKTSKVAGAAVEGIEKLGGEAVGMAKKLPNFIPVGSVTGKDGNKIPLSIGSMKKIPNILEAQMGKIESLKEADMRRALGFEEGKFEKLNQTMAGVGGDIVKALQNSGSFANADFTSTDMKSEPMRKNLTLWAKGLGRPDLKFDDANFDKSLEEIADVLRRNGKIDASTDSKTFVREFKLGGKALGALLKDVDVSIGKIHDIDVEDKETITIQRTNTDSKKKISITIPPEFHTEPDIHKKEAILRKVLEDALKSEKLSTDDNESKVKLKELVRKLLAAQT